MENGFEVLKANVQDGQQHWLVVTNRFVFFTLLPLSILSLGPRVQDPLKTNILKDHAYEATMLDNTPNFLKN